MSRASIQSRPDCAATKRLKRHFDVVLPAKIRNKRPSEHEPDPSGRGSAKWKPHFEKIVLKQGDEIMI
jgi:hypothetical protein